MAITINNLANITYNYGTETDTAVSNIASTQLLEDYSISAEKTSQNSSWRPSENLTFNVRISNDGTQPLYAVSMQDNLGGNTDRLLTYVAGSAKMLRNDVLVGITPSSTEPLTLEIPDILEPGEVVMLTYVAKIKSDIDSAITQITNEAAIVAHQVSVSGPTISITPVPSLTLPKSNYAEVRIEKSVDKEIIATGEVLTYTFNLENSGNIQATNVVITDELPENFVISSITSETMGVATIFEPTDYYLDSNNKLTLPTAATKTISVPAKTEAGNGVTIVTIVGEITA